MADEEKCANPLLLKWIKEWRDFAIQKNTKSITTYKRAYESIKACPITFQHPAEAQQLQGIGEKMCARLTEKMKQHCEENGLPMPVRASKKTRKGLKRSSNGAGAGSGTDADADADADACAVSDQPLRKKRKPRTYVPALRSGAYALLLALGTQSKNSLRGLAKSDLIAIAQPFCNASFTIPSGSRSFYTAWTSMNGLIEKDLVYQKGHPQKRYLLTDEGWEVVQRIQAAESGSGQSTTRETFAENPDGSFASTLAKKSNTNIYSETSTTVPTFGDHLLGTTFVDISSDLISDTLISQISQRGSSLSPSWNRSDHSPVRSERVLWHQPQASGEDEGSAFEPLRLAPGSFTVELVLDTREVRAKTDRDYMHSELAKKGVTPIVQALDLGDAIWIAKCKDGTTLPRMGEEGAEVVLDHILERKRLDDLIASIKDGRFREQKWRLRKSGVRHVVYLVEHISMPAESLNRYAEAVDTAIADTIVHDHFFVKHTQKIDDTIEYLARMTQKLRRAYEDRPLYVLPSGIFTRQNYLPLLATYEAAHVTLTTFSAIVSKSDSLTVRDIFLKMLMCIRGMTGERALVIQKKWRTPREFVSAYRQCTSDADKETMAMNGVGGIVGRLKIGPALSKKVAEVWGK